MLHHAFALMAVTAFVGAGTRAQTGAVGVRILSPRPGAPWRNYVRVHLDVSVGEGPEANGIRAEPHMFQVG